MLNHVVYRGVCNSDMSMVGHLKKLLHGPNREVVNTIANCFLVYNTAVLDKLGNSYIFMIFRNSCSVQHMHELYIAIDSC